MWSWLKCVWPRLNPFNPNWANCPICTLCTLYTLHYFTIALILLRIFCFLVMFKIYFKIWSLPCLYCSCPWVRIFQKKKNIFNGKTIYISEHFIKVFSSIKDKGKKYAVFNKVLKMHKNALFWIVHFPVRLN